MFNERETMSLLVLCKILHKEPIVLFVLLMHFVLRTNYLQYSQIYMISWSLFSLFQIVVYMEYEIMKLAPNIGGRGSIIMACQ